MCIQPVGKHGKNGTDDKDVYMVYSDKKLTKLNELFIHPRVDDMYEQYWEYTFPKLTPIVQSEEKKKFQKIILAPGLFNLNSLESLATAMEISSISAHNGARLVLDYLMSL